MKNGVKAKTSIKAGGVRFNHNRALVKTASKVRAGGLQSNNHNRALVKAASKVRAGGLQSNNHNRGLV